MALRLNRSTYRLLLVLIFSTLLLTSLPITSATTRTVFTCDYDTFTEVLALANSGDAIDFACSGTIDVTQPIVIDKDIIIDGSGQQVVFDGGGMTPPRSKVNRSGHGFPLCWRISSGFSSASAFHSALSC